MKFCIITDKELPDEDVAITLEGPVACHLWGEDEIKIEHGYAMPNQNVLNAFKMRNGRDMRAWPDFDPDYTIRDLTNQVENLRTIIFDHMWYDDPEDGTVCICCHVNFKYTVPGGIERETVHRKGCEIAKILNLKTK